MCKQHEAVYHRLMDSVKFGNTCAPRVYFGLADSRVLRFLLNRRINNLRFANSVSGLIPLFAIALHLICGRSFPGALLIHLAGLCSMLRFVIIEISLVLLLVMFDERQNFGL